MTKFILHSKDVHKNGKEHKDTHTVEKDIHGLYNLVILVAFLSMVRYFIEDYKDYGFIMRLPLSELTLPDIVSFLGILCFIGLSGLVCFGLMRLKISKLKNDEDRIRDKDEDRIRDKVNKVGDDTSTQDPNASSSITNPPKTLLHYLPLRYLPLLSLVFSFSVSAWLTFSLIEHVYISGWSLVVIVIFTIKLISFLLVLNELNSPNLSLSHFLYFLIAPTLCYQSNYPMSSRRSYGLIFKRSIQMVLGIFIFVFVMDQYSIPSIYRVIDNNNVKNVYNSYLIKIENIINVAISSAFLFLIFFLLVFVCALDILSEVTLFDDRNFYQAWWNSKTVGEFWSNWNKPVHNWFKRHLYVPLIHRGTHKQLARAYCFFVSAVIHEFVFSMATKKFSGLIFIAMIFQIPNIYVSETVKKTFSSLANIFFWCSFCVIGQPAIVILYYRSQWLKKV